MGTTTLTLNGTAAMNLVLVAPYSHVDILGNFTMDGGVLAKSLAVSGSVRLNYVENYGAAAALSDMTFALRKASQRYR